MDIVVINDIKQIINDNIDLLFRYNDEVTRVLSTWLWFGFRNKRTYWICAICVKKIRKSGNIIWFKRKITSLLI